MKHPFARCHSLRAAMSLLLTLVMLFSVMPLGVFAAAAPDGYTTDANGLMAYRYNQYLDDPFFYHNVDIKGLVNGEWMSTTWKDRGFQTWIQVGDENEYTYIPANPSMESGYYLSNLGLAVSIDLYFDQTGKTLSIYYRITNYSSTEQYVSIGSGADLQIGSDDKAEITPFANGSGFEMVSANAADHNARFRFLGAPSTMIPVSDFWYGSRYSTDSDDNNHQYYWQGKEAEAILTYGKNQSESGNFDSAVSWHWSDVWIPAGVSATRQVQISVDSLPPHTCNYTYTASGNVLTESCSCGHNETATITAPVGPVVYDGTEKTGATVAYSSNWKGGELGIGYLDNIDAGTARASITKAGATAGVDFTIQPKEIEVAWLNTELVYNGEFQQPTATTDGFVAGDDVVLVVDGSAKIVHSGWEAVAKLDGADKDNYTLSRDTAFTNFTIAPRPIYYKFSNKSFEYIGFAQVPGFYFFDEDDSTASLFLQELRDSTIGFNYTAQKDGVVDYLPTDVGTYTVSLTIYGTSAGNYTLLIDRCDKEFTILPADVQGTAPVATNPVYNGEAQALVSGGSAQGGEMQYALGTDDQAAPVDGWGTAVPTGTNAGAYYVWYKVVGDNNHKGVDPACVPSTIAKLPVTKPVADSTAFLYNGTEQTYSIAASGFYTVAGNTRTAAGTQVVTVALNDTANTEWADGSIEPVEFDFTIARRPVTVTPDDQSMAFGGTEPALTYTTAPADAASGLVDGEQLVGELTREPGTDAGVYAILQGTLDNDNNPNYDILFVTGKTFTITKNTTPPVNPNPNPPVNPNPNQPGTPGGKPNGGYVPVYPVPDGNAPMLGNTTPNRPSQDKDTATDANPNTGDETQLMLWSVLAAGSMLALAGVLVLLKKGRKVVK